MSEFPRDVLLKHAWFSFDLPELKMIILDRGSPDNTSRLEGSRIQRVGRSFMELDEGTMIPFHRILAIYKKEKLLWERKAFNPP